MTQHALRGDRALDDLTHAIEGDILLPDDPRVPEIAATMAGPGSPDLLVRPTTAQDVAAAVRYAGDHGVPLTVRAGGHSMAGASTAADGVALDLRRMRSIEVDPETRIVRIAGGACWGRVAEALQPHGLGLTAGDTAGVGVGGLTLGGGIGWMVRRHGLAIDNLVGAEIVTADGEIREVSEHRHPDLFWALRGGGAGVGVVTRFDFRAQQVADVVFGTVIFALEEAERLLRAWQHAQGDADERLTTTFSLMPAMGDNPAVAMLGLCFAGPEPDSVEVLRPFLELGTVLSSEVSVRPYADVLEQGGHPAGMRVAIDNVLLPGLDDEAIAELAGVHATGGTVVSLRALGGAFSRVAADATAFAHRAAELMVSAVRFSPGPDAPSLHDVASWEAVAARGIGSYVNFRSDLGPDALSAVYPGATGRRLAQVRAEYDPSGVFAAHAR